MCTTVVILIRKTSSGLLPSLHVVELGAVRNSNKACFVCGKSAFQPERLHETYVRGLHDSARFGCLESCWEVAVPVPPVGHGESGWILQQKADTGAPRGVREKEGGGGGMLGAVGGRERSYHAILCARGLSGMS